MLLFLCPSKIICLLWGATKALSECQDRMTSWVNVHFCQDWRLKPKGTGKAFIWVRLRGVTKVFLWSKCECLRSTGCTQKLATCSFLLPDDCRAFRDLPSDQLASLSVHNKQCREGSRLLTVGAIHQSDVFYLMPAFLYVSVHSSFPHHTTVRFPGSSHDGHCGLSQRITSFLSFELSEL